MSAAQGSRRTSLLDNALLQNRSLSDWLLPCAGLALQEYTEIRRNRAFNTPLHDDSVTVTGHRDITVIGYKTHSVMTQFGGSSSSSSQVWMAFKE